jgi:pyruvate,orthophosphate dikinase
MQKWVYLFEHAPAANRDLLGGKGAGIAAMTQAGLPVPPGFTITTEACRQYIGNGDKFPPGLWEEVMAALKALEAKTGKKLGDPENPLLVSVRSGAKFSMPGMMDTVLNLGLNDQAVEGLARQTSNERFALDAYRRFIQMFGRIVLGIPAERFDSLLEEHKKQAGAQQDTDLDAAALRKLVAAFKEVVQRKTGRSFPDNPREQLELAIRAVFGSWMGKRAVDYRNYNKISHDLGTAVNVQAMVFGNMGDDSGTGVAFTRDPSTGDKQLYGEFLPNAQGEDVVAGIRTPLPISEMQRVWPSVYEGFHEIANRLEKTYNDVQDMEFTVERGKLYMLQTRSGKRTARAAVRTAVVMVQEGLIDKQEALMRVEPAQVEQLLLPRFDERAKLQAANQGCLMGRGLPASPGAAVGRVILDADKAEASAKSGEPTILVRPETSPDDFHGMSASQGILTARGGMTSHAAVVARGMGKPCIVGAEGIQVDLRARTISADGKVVKEGEFISIDGATGEVLVGQIETIQPRFADERELSELLAWADEARRLGVWANADTPEEATLARELGAEGIGLCRTEHMFRQADRLPIFRRVILAAPEAARLKATVARLQAQLEQAGPDKRAQAERNLAEAEQELAEPWQVYTEALGELLTIQESDFYGILKAMSGLPVIIRLLDPPLHEFLPRYEELLAEVVRLRTTGADQAELAEQEELLQTVGTLRESNPMLGLRGCRLGILYPEIYEMQVKAILLAAVRLEREGLKPHPEVMIPLIGDVRELARVHEQLLGVAKSVMAEAARNAPAHPEPAEGWVPQQVDYKFGTMLEIPRAAFVADQIAELAEFFSFGTNDLTQTIYGFSRDDAEAKFLGFYVEQGILPSNPFQVLDREGVGAIMRIAVERGRQSRPDLEVGICGEHGGDPASIAFCHEIGLNYVSASPFRAPVARLAAAQAAIAADRERDRCGRRTKDK